MHDTHTLAEKLQQILKHIEHEIDILNKIIDREERNEICKTAMYHRGERYGLIYIKNELLELLA